MPNQNIKKPDSSAKNRPNLTRRDIFQERNADNSNSTWLFTKFVSDVNVIEFPIKVSTMTGKKTKKVKIYNKKKSIPPEKLIAELEARYDDVSLEIYNLSK